MSKKPLTKPSTPPAVDICYVCKKEIAANLYSDPKAPPAAMHWFDTDDKGVFHLACKGIEIPPDLRLGQLPLPGAA